MNSSEKSASLTKRGKLPGRVVKITSWLLLIALLGLFLFNDELQRAWRIWWTGQKLAETQQLWGISMLWWSRIGKILQVCAGLLVVIDLFSPDKLRARGVAARENLKAGRDNWRQLRAARKLVKLHTALFHIVLAPASRRHAFMPRIRHRNYFSPALSRFPRADLEAFAATVREDLALSGRLTAGLVDFDGQDNVSNLADAFLREHLSPEEIELLNRKRSEIVRGRLASAVAFILIALALNRISTQVQAWEQMLLWASGAMAVATALNYSNSFGALSVAWLRSAPLVPLLGTTAAILDRTRPGHVLRWLAFVLFAVGAHFDLLAS